jgi:predicted N-acetyltransferase YhbS
MHQPLTISVVTTADIPAVTRVINSAYQGEPGSKSWTSESHLIAGSRTTEAIMHDLLSKPSVTMVQCCNVEGEVMGCVLLEKKDTTLYLGMLSVSPQAQAAGIGGRLLSYGETFAREHQYTSITITVIHLRYELIAWYQRKGFVPTGNRESFSNKSSTPVAAFYFMEMKKELL